ncbi:amino acid transporter, partial [Mycobacterium kansasii]
GDLGWSAASGLADSVLWSTVAGVIWIVIMTYICYRGIEVSARLQYWLLTVEVVVLIAFAVVALIKVYTHNAESYSLLPSLSWFWPGGMDF